VVKELRSGRGVEVELSRPGGGRFVGWGSLGRIRMRFSPSKVRRGERTIFIPGRSLDSPFLSTAD